MGFFWGVGFYVATGMFLIMMQALKVVFGSK